MTQAFFAENKYVYTTSSSFMDKLMQTVKLVLMVFVCSAPKLFFSGDEHPSSQSVDSLPT